MLDRVNSAGNGLFAAIIPASGFGMASLVGVFMPDMPGSGVFVLFVGGEFGAVFVELVGICGAIPETG